MALRCAALGGFEPSQARPLQGPLAGAALVALVGLGPTRLQELVVESLDGGDEVLYRGNLPRELPIA